MRKRERGRIRRRQRGKEVLYKSEHGLYFVLSMTDKIFVTISTFYITIDFYISDQNFASFIGLYCIYMYITVHIFDLVYPLL